MNVRYRRLLAALLAFAILGCSRGAADPGVRIVAPDGSERASVRVEIARTNAEQELGLMYRNHLDPDAGMIFIFAASEPRTFWMKNTEIPLDMIFADDKARVVGIVANAEPYTETPRAVGAPAQYVLEVNGGFCAAHHVVSGDTLAFEGFDPHGHP
jgi:uncharacterized protein